MVKPDNHTEGSDKVSSRRMLGIAAAIGTVSCAAAVGSFALGATVPDFQANEFPVSPSRADSLTQEVGFDSLQQQSDTKANREDQAEEQNEQDDLDKQNILRNAQSANAAYRQSAGAAAGSVAFAVNGAGGSQAGGSASGPVIVDGGGSTDGGTAPGGDDGDGGDTSVDPDPASGTLPKDATSPYLPETVYDWPDAGLPKEEMDSGDWSITVTSPEKVYMENGTLEQLYKGERMNDAKLLRTCVFYAVHTTDEGEETWYRITDFSKWLSHSAIPEVLGDDQNELEITFTLDFLDNWKPELNMILHVYDSKVFIEGIDDSSMAPSMIAFVDLPSNTYAPTDPNEDHVHSEGYANLTELMQNLLQWYAQENEDGYLADSSQDIWNAFDEDGLKVTKLFKGWTVGSTGEYAALHYVPGSKGYTKLSLVPLEDLSDEYDVVLSWLDQDELHQELRGYSGSSEALNVPQGIRCVALAAESVVQQVERLVLPNSVQKVDFTNLSVAKRIEVAADNAWLYVKDNVLYSRGSDGEEDSWVYNVDTGEWNKPFDISSYDVNDPSTWPNYPGFDAMDPDTWPPEEDPTYGQYYWDFFWAYVDALWADEDDDEFGDEDEFSDEDASEEAADQETAGSDDEGVGAEEADGVNDADNASAADEAAAPAAMEEAPAAEPAADEPSAIAEPEPASKAESSLEGLE